MFHLGPALRYSLFCLFFFFASTFVYGWLCTFTSILYVLHEFSFVLDLRLQKAYLQFKDYK